MPSLVGSLHFFQALVFEIETIKHTFNHVRIVFTNILY